MRKTIYTIPAAMTAAEVLPALNLVQYGPRKFVWCSGSFPVSISFRTAEVAVEFARQQGWMK
ncbi:MAG: hypothetical protein V1755_13755 [Chloroflexota bacterium]